MADRIEQVDLSGDPTDGVRTPAERLRARSSVASRGAFGYVSTILGSGAAKPILDCSKVMACSAKEWNSVGGSLLDLRRLGHRVLERLRWDV